MAKKNYLPGVEIFRILAAFAVICIHIPPFAKTVGIPHHMIWFYGISHLCRFAVPYFFLAAGYFYGKNLEETNLPGPLLHKRLKRLFFLFIAWSLIYAILPDAEPLKQALTHGLSLDQIPSLFPITQRFSENFQAMPLNFLLEGNTGHLWFLTALMSAYAVLYFFRNNSHGRALIFTAVGLYLFGLLNSHYRDTPIGIHLPFTFDFRNGPIFSTLFVVVGFELSKIQRVPALPVALPLTLAGLLIQETEAFLLYKFFGVGAQFNYLVGTVAFASGLFLLSLHIHQPDGNALLLGLSKLTLGIYLCHLIAEKTVLFLLTPPDTALWQLLFPLIVFLVAALGTFILKKIPVTKPIVS